MSQDVVTTVIATAQSIRSGHANPNMLVMGDGLYIHDMTPELARQWIGVLEPLGRVASDASAP